MDDFDEPSVLAYARSHGVAKDHRQLSPLSLFAQIRESEYAQSHFKMESTQFFDPGTSDFSNRTLIFESKNEKLVLDKDGVNFLTAVLQEVTLLQGEPDHRAADTIPHKLEYKSRDDLKIDVPLISTAKRNALNTSSKAAVPDVILNKIVPILADRERSSIDEGIEFPDYFWELPSMLDRDPSTAKLDAPGATREVLREALIYLDERRHRDYVEKVVACSILDVASSSQLAMPLMYIESEAQHEKLLGRDSRGTETNINDRVFTENVATPGLLEEDDLDVENTGLHVETEDQHQRSSIRQFDSNGTDTGLVDKVGFEEVDTPGLLEEDHQPVEDALCHEKEEQHERNSVLGSHNNHTDIDLSIPMDECAATRGRSDEQSTHTKDAATSERIGSPLPLHDSKDVTKKSPTSRTALSPRTNLPVSLGTLSAFMQTRCNKNKRPKLDHESRYFSRTLTSSMKSRPVGADTPDRTANSTKLPFTPAATHKIQSLDLYPKYHLKESNQPILLIVSTHLLGSDSTLIQLLEDHSGPRSVRLIFRDYRASISGSTTSNAGQQHVLNEADMIVSPTTGLILASSHETTQKYLPGQGPPGVDSTLHARIIQVTPRYETLYVLLRSPLETSINVLSSVRDFRAYCMSLNPMCNIKVLLIATDDILAWVLSIAAKHTPDLLFPLNTTESRAPASQFHDDQTQWEVFLRSAGLNPFAAQSVLAVLKTSSAHSRHSEDVIRASALSDFVEMPCRTRRDMFEKLVGQRVLSRVQKALEIDWQLDWAVDLA